MFDFGFSEMLLVAVVALIVVGPQRLPKVARTVGHLLGRMQRYVSDVKADVSREMQLEELKKLQEQVKDQARDLESSVRQQADSVESEFRQTTSEVRKSIEDDAPAGPPMTPAPSASEAWPAEPAAPAPGVADESPATDPSVSGESRPESGRSGS
ncbi:Sec-independent protein translocase protein TatB [Pseudazoarcus pumilus]|uniref:Sec-independent protein translocase protein TatB n=1 Tax=Pseudazoarcus pumilus TaxID=2067960 RepID=A0A2I6S5L2_9RHOO|nr:Sec-independent protein translocase protein TatB [Pseudazoarcus pumilus]AUN94543.1 twin-arginine translocase subunit TatB [Pseudazoarcus pumilus]